MKDSVPSADPLLQLNPELVVQVACVSASLFLSSLVLMHWNTLNVGGFAAVQSWTRVLPDAAWSAITICGAGIAAYALLTPTLAWRPRWMAAALAAAPFSVGYSRLLKHLYGLPRPAAVLDPTSIHVIGATLRANSFPSGHAVTAFTVAAVLVFASRTPQLTALWAVPLALLVAVSRIAVGAHWPADLAAGAAGGWTAGVLGVAIAMRWRVWNTIAGIRIMAIAAVCIGAALFVSDLRQPSAVPLQYALGLLAFASGMVAALRPRLDPALLCRPSARPVSNTGDPMAATDTPRSGSKTGNGVDRVPSASAPLFIVLNATSGHGDTDETCKTIERVLDDAGRAHEILRVENAGQLAAICRRAVACAQNCDGIVVAAGGDGTLNAVAQATIGSGCLFGVIPQGTFNYFGRTHGISSDTAEGTRSLLTARVHPVQVGLVNDRIFLVNASLGLYPRLLEDREEQKQRHGRNRLVAAWSALLTISRSYRPMVLKLEQDGQIRELRALSLFVGNNRLQLEQVGLTEADAVEDGQLAAILVRPAPRLALLWLAVKGSMGKLAEVRGVDHVAMSNLTVSPAARRVRRMKIATDGEVGWMNAPIRFSVAPEPLLLLKPVDAVPETAVR